MRKTACFAAVLTLLFSSSTPADAQSRTRWTDAYVQQWIDVYMDWMAQNPGVTDCVSLFTAAVAGLENARATDGVWWEDLTNPHPDTVRYGSTTFVGMGTKMMVDARKASPIGGVPGTVTHEAAHASREYKYSAPPNSNRLRYMVHPLINTQVGRCVPLLTNLPVIPTSN